MSSTETNDAGLFKMMGFVMLALTVFTLTCMFMARILGSEGVDPTDTVMRNALMERISPVGKIRTAAMVEAAGGDAGAEPAVVADLSGEELYNGGCAACHASGVANAPKFGDADAWAVRNESGLEALVASAIGGIGSMPPRGGSSYSDEEIERAVKHLTGL